MYLWGGKGGIRKRLTSSSSNDSVPLLWERDLVDQAFPPISRPLKKWFDPQYPIPKRRLMGISKLNVTINARAQTSYIKSIVIHLFTSPLLPPPLIFFVLRNLLVDLSCLGVQIFDANLVAYIIKNLFKKRKMKGQITFGCLLAYLPVYLFETMQLLSNGFPSTSSLKLLIAEIKRLS